MGQGGVESIQINRSAGEDPPKDKPPENIEGDENKVVVKPDADGQVAPPKDEGKKPERPDWLPEKFESVEDFVKSYGELEKKLGSGEPKQTPKPDDAAEAVKKSGLDMAAVNAEYAENGALSEATYEKLEKAGFDKTMVDSYIEGVKSRGAQMMQTATEAVGGEDNLKAILGWAKGNLSEADITAYDNIIDTGDLAAIDMAVRGLQAKYVAANGQEPNLVTGESVSGRAPSVAPFKSTSELTTAMKDPRYRTDPSYRKEVEQRLAVSKVFD